MQPWIDGILVQAVIECHACADGPLNFINQSGAINYYPSEFSSQVTHLLRRGAGPSSPFAVCASVLAYI